MLRFILLTGLYMLGSWYAEAFIAGPSQVTLIWPSAGIAYAAALRYGWRWIGFIPVAVLLSHAVFVEVPPAFLPFSVLSNTLGALAGAWIVQRSAVVPRLTVASGFTMMRGGVVMAVVSGGMGTAGLVYAGMVPAQEMWPALFKWSMGDLLGIITLAPTLLLVSAPGSDNPDQPRSGDYSPPREKFLWLLEAHIPQRQ